MVAKKKLALIGGVAVIVIGIAIGITIWQVKKNKDKDTGENAQEDIKPVAPSHTPLGIYGRAAISADAPGCAQIGRSILDKNGTAADSVIATALCMGVLHSQSMGIGGGFFAVYYDRASGASTVLNAREKAPAAATEDMFHGDPNLSQKGGLAVAVPGEFKGYWELYKRFGSFNRPEGPRWADLIQPTIRLCEEGFIVDNHTANAFIEQKANIMSEPSLKAIFVNATANDVYQLGNYITRPVLARTLRTIANDPVNGGNLLYMRESQLAQDLVNDLRQDFEGIMTIEDLVNYQIDIVEPIKVPVYGGFMLHTVPPPGSGALMAFIMRVVGSYELEENEIRRTDKAPRTYQLITEAFKHAYAKRTLLGDPKDPAVTETVESLVYDLTKNETFLEEIRNLIHYDSTNNTYEYYGAEFYAPEDHGTAHVSVVDQWGNAVALTSTVNLYFGAKIRSKSTGIIYNDEMDDFSAPNITNYFGVPPSPNNFIVPHKTPMSSMTPAIFTDAQGNVRLAVGTAGGTRITTATAYVSMRNLWFGENIKEAIDARRTHHQLYPMAFQYDSEDFPQEIVEKMIEFGHNVTTYSIGSSVTCGIARYENGSLAANADFRKDGSIDGY